MPFSLPSPGSASVKHLSSPLSQSRVPLFLLHVDTVHPNSFGEITGGRRGWDCVCDVFLLPLLASFSFSSAAAWLLHRPQPFRDGSPPWATAPPLVTPAHFSVHLGRGAMAPLARSCFGRWWVASTSFGTGYEQHKAARDLLPRVIPAAPRYQNPASNAR